MNLEQLERELVTLRVRVRRGGPLPDRGPVVYWMQRSQRGRANLALDVAIAAANLLGAPLLVFLAPRGDFPGATRRSLTFLMQGIADIAEDVSARGATLVLRSPPQTSLLQFCREVGARLVVGDEHWLREPMAWRAKAADRLDIPYWTVDSDVVVPLAALPQKEEWAARTLRPRIHALLPAYLCARSEPDCSVPWVGPLPHSDPLAPPEELLQRLGPIDESAQPVAQQGGRRRGLATLQRLVRQRLRLYLEARNEPSEDGSSGLSAYLHFGHLSPLEVALAVEQSDAPQPAKDAFLEQLIVRRELAIQFCARNPHYDSLQGCADWARLTLDQHRADPRAYTCDLATLEQARTADPAWNAAQTQLLRDGTMHGYLRMYWAKKILEWSPTPEIAFERALLLNDRYQLDGRDPNGYTGVAWAVGGKHDRPWAPRRPVFGTIRFMNAAGLARKTNLAAYLARFG